MMKTVKIADIVIWYGIIYIRKRSYRQRMLPNDKCRPIDVSKKCFIITSGWSGSVGVA